MIAKWRMDQRCWGLGLAFLWGPKGERYGKYSHWWQVFWRAGCFWGTVDGLIAKRKERT